MTFNRGDYVQTVKRIERLSGAIPRGTRGKVTDYEAAEFPDTDYDWCVVEMSDGQHFHATTQELTRLLRRSEIAREG